MGGSRYRDLAVWQKSLDMVVQCYEVARAVPTCGPYSLTGQMRRAAVSVPANIAEGQARQHRREFLHHLSVARGSLAELEAHIEIAKRVGYVGTDMALGLFSQTQEAGRMINGLRASLRQTRPAEDRSAD